MLSELNQYLPNEQMSESFLLKIMTFLTFFVDNAILKKVGEVPRGLNAGSEREPTLREVLASRQGKARITRYMLQLSGIPSPSSEKS